MNERDLESMMNLQNQPSFTRPETQAEFDRLTFPQKCILKKYHPVTYARFTKKANTRISGYEQFDITD